MKQAFRIGLLACFCAPADASVLYQQLPSPSGASYVSSWWDPDGSNYDQYVWDAFTLGQRADVSAIQWRGTYGTGGPVSNFAVAIYASIPAETQPDLGHPPLAEYETGGNAGQTYAGVFGGVTMYDYTFMLPATFRAELGVKYWVQIEGWQSGFPDWSLAAAQSGDGSHFLCQHNNIVGLYGVPPGCWFTTRTGDTAFILIGTVVTGLEDTQVQADFGLSGVSPNPSRGDRLDVMFSLPNAAPAQLALFDVGGRQVTSMEVGLLGAGLHGLDLVRFAPVRSGIYFIRLTRGDQVVTTRATIVR